jgi:RAQPRD family integrative conjugative element protein
MRCKAVDHQRRSGIRIRHVLAALALGACLGLEASALDGASERAELAGLLRQIDLLERLALQSEAHAATTNTRYHFDYARLREDLARVRAGIEDYLSPPRAQPRDPQPLSGNYRREKDPAP